jgi:predicted dehydrogenase
MPSVGLVGCGRWGRLVLRDLVSLGAAVTVVASNENARFAATAGAERVVSSLEHLPQVDGIVVVTPTSTHADVIDTLLPRGVPIFCEKPLCDDADRAARLAVEGDGRVFVMDKWRYHSGVLELASIARGSELGPVVGLRTTRIGYSHTYADTDCIWTLLPHDLAIAYEILGTVLPPRSATADRVGTRTMGLVATLAANAGPWHVAEIGIRSPVEQRAVTLFCRDGAAMLQDSYSDHVLVVDNPPPDGGAKVAPRMSRRSIAEEMPLLAELSAFVDHIKGGPPPKSSVREAADTVRTISDVRRLAGL